jgi:hypothetical protein
MERLSKSEKKRLQERDQRDCENWDYLFTFLSAYFEASESCSASETANKFNASQHTLLAYNCLVGEVTNGGFIQLIHNGYGSYVFDSPFLETIKSWGLEKIAEITQEAKTYYLKYKAELESEKTPEEFSQLYSDIKVFEPLETRFYDAMIDETEKLRKYIELHANDFVFVTCRRERDGLVI